MSPVPIPHTLPPKAQLRHELDIYANGADKTSPKIYKKYEMVERIGWEAGWWCNRNLPTSSYI